MERLEKEVGFKKFLPKSVIENKKSKNIRKMIQENFHKCAELSEEDCVFRFLQLLGERDLLLRGISNENALWNTLTTFSIFRRQLLAVQ